jgi:hypothetical protein
MNKPKSMSKAQAEPSREVLHIGRSRAKHKSLVIKSSVATEASNGL